MKNILIILFVLFSVSAFAQVSSTKVVRIANATTNFSESLSEGNMLIDLNINKCYLILNPIAGTNSIADLTVNVDYKEIVNSSATDSTFVWVKADTVFVDHINTKDSTEIRLNTNLIIEADGTIRMENDATVWHDLNVYPDAVKKQGINDPADTQFKTDGSGSTGVFLDAFADDKDREVFFTVQLPHGYKEGTDLHPHVHWTPMAGTPSGSDVTWGLEYTVVAVGELFGNTTIITGSTVIPAISSFTGPGQHLINSLGVIDGSPSGNPLRISSVLVCRLFRDVSAGTFGNPVGLLGMDFHYEQDTQGSRLEFVK